MSQLPMYCDQCEQTAHNTGCTTKGVCGKSADVESLQKLLLYGVKGMAAYKSHARRLGKTNPQVEGFIEDALFATMTNVNFDEASLLDLIWKCGQMSYATLQMLDAGHTEQLGRPELVEVEEGIQGGPGILVSGHDMVDLLRLLEQCEGTGIKVYTHGELLPAHSYPRLRAFECLAGHYGSAWQRQRWDFERFGGPVVATTNCVLIPWETNTYLSRLFTTRYTAVPGAHRITNDDFSGVIEAARNRGPMEGGSTTKRHLGWHHSRILDNAPALLAAVKTGEIKHFFVIGGCDGAEPGRNYFSKYAESTPEDSVILTMGCGKYRILDGQYGTTAGFPRLMDMGQCNDAFGAIQVALGLSRALERDLNELPLTIQLSWFEQKAIAVLLALFYLGVKGVALGPNLPAFLSDKILEQLVDRFGVRPLGTNPSKDVMTDMAMN